MLPLSFISEGILAEQAYAILKKSLVFLHMGELREISRRLSLVDKGNKRAIILRILHFLSTGERLSVPKFPEASRAQRGKEYPLAPTTQMLKGSYKNDLKTRLFLKKLIGNHFHFTAFGIDWLNDRWMEGNPPTYQEFAHMWQGEHEKRKKMPAAPKEEWAYINFIQKTLQNSPELSRESVIDAWERERQKHKAIVDRWFDNFIK